MSGEGNTPDEVEKLADALGQKTPGWTYAVVSIGELRALARAAAAVGARTALERVKSEFDAWTPFQSRDTGETFLANSVRDQIDNYLDEYTTNEETTA
jgi:hypothetical protein